MFGKCHGAPLFKTHFVPVLGSNRLELVSTDKDSIIAYYKIATTRMCYLAQDQESRSVGNNRDPNHTKQFNDSQINVNNNRKRNLITVSDN